MYLFIGILMLIKSHSNPKPFKVSYVGWASLSSNWSIAILLSLSSSLLFLVSDHYSSHLSLPPCMLLLIKPQLPWTLSFTWSPLSCPHSTTFILKNQLTVIFSCHDFLSHIDGTVLPPPPSPLLLPTPPIEVHLRGVLTMVVDVVVTLKLSIMLHWWAPCHSLPTTFSDCH